MVRILISSHWKRTSRLPPTVGTSRRNVPLLLMWVMTLALQFSGLNSHARVFWTSAGGQTSGILSSDATWSRAYASMVRINGGKAGVEVWNASMSLEETMNMIRARVSQNGSAIWFNGSGEMVWAIACDGDRVFRFLLTSGLGPRSCLVYQISQSFEDFKASLESPKTHLFKHAPAFPDSEPRTFLASEKTRTEMESSTSASNPEEVQEFYANRLKTSGWATPFAAGKGSGFYVKGNEALLVSTQTAGDGGGCLIMLLHKPLAVDEGN